MGDFETICKKIKDLKIQGAENIAKTGIKALLIKHDRKSIKKLLSQRPTEPLLKNSVKYILRQKDIKQGVKAALDHINSATLEINKIGYSLIHGKVFTHCHSSTIIGILKLAKKKGKKFSVVNTETRPKFQGRKTAKELANANIKVTTIIDSLAGKYIKKSDIFIIGADAITKNGVINKVGSNTLAELAHIYKIPVYIAVDSWKFSDKPVKIEERNFKEVWENAPKKIKIKNPAFGRIEKKYITGIISELGILKFDNFTKEVKNPNKARKAVAMDLDETLIHSNDVHIKALNGALEKNGIKKLKYEKIKDALTGEPTRLIVKKLSLGLSKQKIESISYDHHKFVFKYSKYAKPIKGVVKALKNIKKRYDIALISNCSHKEILALLKGAKINKNYFDIIIGKDQVKKTKPFPDELIKAKKNLHKNIVYMVGDSVHDIKAGKKLGIKTIAVLTGNTKLNLIKKQKPDYVVDTIAEVDEIV